MSLSSLESSSNLELNYSPRRFNYTNKEWEGIKEIDKKLE